MKTKTEKSIVDPTSISKEEYDEVVMDIALKAALEKLMKEAREEFAQKKN